MAVVTMLTCFSSCCSSSFRNGIRTLVLLFHFSWELLQWSFCSLDTQCNSFIVLIEFFV